MTDDTCGHPTGDDASGLFCQCGCSPGTQVRPRELGTLLDHTRNAAHLLSTRGYDLDLDVLVDVVEDLKTQPSRTGREEQIIGEAVAYAVLETPDR